MNGPDDDVAEQHQEPRAEPEVTTAPAPEPEWKRRRRLAEIFGDVEPSVTRDEVDPPARRSSDSATDRWLKSQVPPHHGG